MGYKKWTALFLSLALAATIFISYLCIAEKASHDCEGDQCPVCGEIEMCIETIAHYHSLLDGTGAGTVLSGHDTSLYCFFHPCIYTRIPPGQAFHLNKTGNVLTEFIFPGGM